MQHIPVSLHCLAKLYKNINNQFSRKLKLKKIHTTKSYCLNRWRLGFWWFIFNNGEWRRWSRSSSVNCSKQWCSIFTGNASKTSERPPLVYILSVIYSIIGGIYIVECIDVSRNRFIHKIMGSVGRILMLFAALLCDHSVTWLRKVFGY